MRHDGLKGSFGQHLCDKCQKEEGSFRCKDCSHRSGLLCQACLIPKHRELELHRIEVRLLSSSSVKDFSHHLPSQKWNGQFFEKTTLAGLGLRIQLGHDGGPCPCPSCGPQNFVVFDLSGAHAINIDYCECTPDKSLEKRLQLLRKRWFPATLARLQTVFTFDCLEFLHELTLQGKVNLFDFYHTILRRTDNACISTTTVSPPTQELVKKLTDH